MPGEHPVPTTDTTRGEIARQAASYPAKLIAAVNADVERQIFHVGTVQRLTGNHGTVADIGGGVGLFSVGCAAIGLHAILVDDFADPVNELHGDEALRPHRDVGVGIVRRDVIADGLGLDAESCDVITTFDSVEHWHHSPKRLFADVMAALKPGGWFFMGVPNAVNLRKRIQVPLGKGSWSQMADWYEQPVFRGHVREPSVPDLHYIARDMGLVDVQIIGRNWLAYQAGNPRIRWAAPHIDRILQRRPSLCSDIYLLGRKP